MFLFAYLLLFHKFFSLLLLDAFPLFQHRINQRLDVEQFPGFFPLLLQFFIYEVDIDEKESAVQNLQRAYQIFRSVLQYDNDLLTKKEQRIKELLQAAGLTSEDIQKLLKTTDI